jgi:hypothetical protein
MPDVPPLTSSASRELRRPRQIPPKLREAIGLMVYGHPDDPDCRAFTFVEAAHEMGIKPDVMRRYLDRPEVGVLLLAERRAFRAAICGGNEGALLRVRETALSPPFVRSRSSKRRATEEASTSLSIPQSASVRSDQATSSGFPPT